MQLLIRSSLLGFLLLVGVASAQAVESIEQAANRLHFDSLTPEWTEFLDGLEAVQCVEARFEEARYFKFKTEPQRYTGVFRKDASGAVSLAYESGTSMALHVGEGYAYYRKGDDAPKPIPGFSSQKNAVSLLPVLLSLDLEALNDFYEIYGRSDEAGAWSLRLVERENIDVDLEYEQIELSGEGTMVSLIELRKGAMRSIEIRLDAPVLSESFSPEVREQFFFVP